MNIEKNTIKIKRTFMRDEAYDILQEWIMIGKLEPDVRLRDQELSDLLGISRTPIREALLKLEDEGLVVTKANRWTIVSPIDIEQAEHIYSMVEVLESLAIEQGQHNISHEVIDELERINEEFKEKLQKGDKVATFQADTDFHETIVKLSNNMELLRVLIHLKVKIQRMEIHYFSLKSDSLESYDEHIKIIEAFKKNDLHLIQRAIKNNWKNSLARIQEKRSWEIK